jgi:hypothetical protein
MQQLLLHAETSRSNVYLWRCKSFWMRLVFFSLFVDFLWSEQVVNGLFVVCLDLEMWSIACNLYVWWLMEDKDGI